VKSIRALCPSLKLKGGISMGHIKKKKKKSGRYMSVGGTFFVVGFTFFLGFVLGFLIGNNI